MPRGSRITLLAITAVLSLAGSGVAITGGQADGDGHPYVALLLAPGLTSCSGALISEDAILTAGHCTDFWDFLAGQGALEAIMVSFDSRASVDDEWMPDGGTWLRASRWATYPDYDSDAWPYTFDYGLLYLDVPAGRTPADLTSEDALRAVIGGNGQTTPLFDDVGYGAEGAFVGGGPPRSAITWTRTMATQRYAPGNGTLEPTSHPTWFIVQNVPSPRHGGTCEGDSGSPVLFGDTDEIVAVHTGSYRLGRGGVICGRLASLNHRIDLPSVLHWIIAND
jgi:hypothetical protein